MSETYNLPVDQIKQILGSTDSIKEDLKLNKAVELLVENRKEVEQRRSNGRSYNKVNAIQTSFYNMTNKARIFSFVPCFIH